MIHYYRPAQRRSLVPPGIYPLLPRPPIGGYLGQLLALLLVLLLSISSLAQTRVYYTVSDGSFNSLNDQLRSIPLNGGAEAPVYSNSGSSNFAASPTQIAYDAAGDRVFVANAVATASAIYVVSASGTATLFKTVASIPSAASTVVTGMVVDNVGGYLYYNLSDNVFGSRLDQLRRIPLAGGNEETFVGSNTANFPATPQALALDRQNNRLLTTNGVSSTVANSEGNNLYVSAIDLNSRAVTKAFTFTEISSGGTTVITTQGGIAVNTADNSLYYVVRDNSVNTFNDQLRRISLSGGTEQLVVDVNSNGRGFPTSPGFLAYDAANNRVLVHDLNINNRDIVAVTPAGAITTLLNDGAQIGSANTSIMGIAVGAAAAAPPTVTTAAAASITSTSAVLGGNVTTDGGATVTERGVVYSSTNTTPTIGSGTQNSNASGPGTFSESITGLTAGTIYYVRAYAINSAGTSYGSVVSFATPVPPATVTSIVRASATPTNAATVSYTVTFGSSVTGVTTSNFDATTTGTLGTATINSVSGSGTTYTVTVNTGSNGTGSGTLTLRLANATGILPGISTALPYSGETYTIDKTPPVVSSVTAPANGTYRSGQTLSFTVNFTEAVVVAGTPQLGLTIGSTSRQASYAAGSGGTALTFSYSVQSGELDTDGITLGSLALNGGSLRDAVGNAAALGPNGVPSTAGVLIDAVAPTVSSSNRQNPTATLTNATSLTYRVTFSEAVMGVATNSFLLVTTGTATGSIASVASVSGVGGTQFDVTISSLSGIGTMRLDVTSSGSGITDAAGNALSGGYASGQTYTIDQTGPTAVISSTAGSNGSTTTASPLAFTVTFSESVTGFSQSDLSVTGGNVSSFSGSGSTYSFLVTPAASGPVTVGVAAGVAQDAAGNSNTAASPYTLTYQQPQTQAPVVTAPANNSQLNTNTPTYNGTAPANAVVTVYVDGTAIGTTPASAGGIFSLTQPAALAQGSHTVFATAQLSGQRVSPSSSTNTFTVATTAVYSSSTADQPMLERVPAGSTNQVLLRVAVTSGGGSSSPLTAQSFTFTTTGSTSAADIAAARVYYTGTSDTFAAGKEFGAAVATPSGAFTIAGAQQLATGTNYFWLVYDVAVAAPFGNVLDATITSLRVSGAEYTPSATNPAGNRQIILISRVAGQALHFTGGATAGSVDFSTSATFPAPLLGEHYTQVAWIKPTLGSGNTTYYVLGNGTGSTAAPYIAITGNGRVEAGFGTGTTLRSVQTGPQTITTNAWHQIAATFNGTLLTLYLNGNAIATLTSPATDAPGGTRVAYVGSAGPTGDNFFPGDIDEVSQWNRALSTAELRRLRHLTLSGTETGLISYLQFNDAGTTTTDGVGGSAGTLTGATRVSSTAPVGAGISNLQSVTGANTYSFTGTNAAINFTTVAGAPYDVVVTRLEGTPLGTPVTDASLRSTHTRAYWVVDKYSTSNFAATITYTLDQNLISPADAAAPGVLKLYKRGSNSDGAFEAPISATAANAAAGTVTFPVTSFSQTFIGTYGSSPLPVELVRFRAEASGTAALLRWTTSQEISNDRFEVQRSPDGRVFTTVGTLPGAGTSAVAHSYTFTDAQAGQVGKQVHYRLRQVDTNGQASLSSVEVVRFGVTSRLVLWPNPSTDRLHLDLSSFPEARYTVLVTDALGRTVLTTQVTPAPATTLSVAELPAGSYLLHVLGTTSRTTHHFIKQK
ncbi:T9SS type A sorting domain-containing protein [Hymenobacter sp. HSC-4F20]|uniref:LamG-like jellyroll fold domain-containing protein n=1 Tax=Hymenobacter sp. HSC-4F20 TaxID=2864135 RepID=UPI001C73AA6E|nr:LamG-like jellyroll fold domain-containing protein [Hymenobacter sp. HSC-4F20]MBX0290372.1 T9SS type A sorting domain-containing protein [Hymenobacter sp. HSC-4F20]